jgi:hypothetical protein
MQKRISFTRPKPTNIKIDYDNMIIYYEGCDQGQHVFNFIYLYKSWDLLFTNYQSQIQTNIIENWKCRYEAR